MAENDPVTRESLEGLTAEQLSEQYNLPKARKSDMVDAIEANGFAPFEITQTEGSVTLAVNGLDSNEFFYDSKAEPITVSGTTVPAGKAASIIAAAAQGGVRVFEKTEG